GVFSAWGMLNTDIRHNTVYTHITRMDAPDASETLNRIYNKLEEEIRDMFRYEGVEGQIVIERYADIRYYGQEHTVRVPIQAEEIEKYHLKTILESFHQIHEREYEFRLEGSLVEVVNFQVVGIKRTQKLELKELPEAASEAEDPILTERRVYMNGVHEKLPVYDRTKLARGAGLEGPAILEDPTSTIIVLQGQTVEVDRFGNISIRSVGR
ncbi:MAG: hydantoinase/oxoprolinase family protein, partial [Candidatus Bathyarchaeia archaeon]